MEIRPIFSIWTRRAARHFVFLMSVAPLLAGCADEPDTAPLQGWNVLLLTIDTTRTEGLSCYPDSHERARTPELDRWAAEGALFENAVAVAPLTLPTHASILTGAYPSFHGARDNGLTKLDDGRETLAEILKENGYQCGAAVSVGVLHHRYGLAQGFDVFDDDPTSMSRPVKQVTDPCRGGEDVTRAAISIASGFDPNRPYFLWTHYFDPHTPYFPPGDLVQDVEEKSGPVPYYLAEITATDRLIGLLRGVLTRSGLMRNTLVIIVADHGEGVLGPHDEPTHGIYLYRDTLDIPFIMVADGVIPAGKRVRELVSQVDIVPTVLDLLGIEGGAEVQGKSLRSLLLEPSTTDEPAEPRAVYSETLLAWDVYGWSPLYQVTRGDWKYIAAPQPELYRLSDDPDETTNLIDRYPEVAEDLRNELVRIHAEAPEDAGDTSVVITPDEKKRLRELGYATDSAGVAPPPSELASLPNPMAKFEVHTKINAIGELFARDNKVEEAIDETRLLLQREPNNYQAHFNLATYLFSLGRFDEAIPHLVKLTEFRPDQPQGYVLLGDAQLKSANAFRETDPKEYEARIQKALVTFQKSVELGALDSGAYINLGFLYIRQGDLERADKILRKGITLNDKDYSLHQNLAVCLMNRKRYREALEEFRIAEGLLEGDVDRLKLNWANQADAAFALGDAAESRRILLKLVQTFPSDPRVEALRARIQELEEMDRKSRGTEVNAPGGR